MAGAARQRSRRMGLNMRTIPYVRDCKVVGKKSRQASDQ
jgi:hypothetical protein